MITPLDTEEQRKAFMDTLMWVSRTQSSNRKAFHHIRVKDTENVYVIYEGNDLVLLTGRDASPPRYVDGIEAKLVKMAAWPYYEGDL